MEHPRGAPRLRSHAALPSPVLRSLRPSPSTQQAHPQDLPGAAAEGRQEEQPAEAGAGAEAEQREEQQEQLMQEGDEPAAAEGDALQPMQE